MVEIQGCHPPNHQPIQVPMETILIPARYYDYHHRLPFEWAQVVRLDGSLN